MKKTIALIVTFLSLGFAAQAQWIVYDPAMNTQQIIDEAESIAKYVQMIDNQVQQIQTLTSQLNQFEHYEALFGDPSQIALQTVAPLAADLQKIEPVEPLEGLVANISGDYALTYDDLKLFQNIGVSFSTPRGQIIRRNSDQYKPFAAIINTASNYVAVADDASARRTEIKQQIAQTIEQLNAAKTDAEVQKLHGILTSLNGDLASTDAELNQAVGSVLVQDIQNRNDQLKREQGMIEQQNAEFQEAVSNSVEKFQLLNEPVLFPTP
jgi:hypothetical protein